MMKSSISITLPCETNSTNSVIRSASPVSVIAPTMMPAVPVATPMPIMLRAPSLKPWTSSSEARGPGARRAGAAEEIEEWPLRRHQHGQHHDRPERGQRRRHLLDHQAPDQHADRQQEVQAGADGGPGVERARRVDVDVLRQVRARGRLLHREEVECADDRARRPRRGGAEKPLDAGERPVDERADDDAARETQPEADPPLPPRPRACAR